MPFSSYTNVQSPSTYEQPLVEILVRSFYPTPYTASPAFTLTSPWYLDYGHLSYWFFIGSTVVIVLWLIYTFNSLSRNIEERRPVRESRGFSRAQTGDTLTAVLPLTWSVTMLGHASTHSINFDENTTATTFSFTVIAYQWGWNYFFPREVADLLASAPRLSGRGRVIQHYTQDRYSGLLARARGEYMSQVTLTGALTAKHGRHVVSSVLSVLTPTLSLEAAEAPTWAAVSSSASLLNHVGSAEARLLCGSPALGSVHHVNLGRLFWQRQMGGRLLGLGAAQAASTSYQPLIPNTNLSNVLFTPSTYHNETSTQNLRPLSTTVWAGNRLQRIHRYLAAPRSNLVGGTEQTVSSLLHRQSRTEMASLESRSVSLSPVNLAHLSLEPQTARLAPSTSWAASTLHDSSVGAFQPTVTLEVGGAFYTNPISQVSFLRGFGVRSPWLIGSGNLDQTLIPRSFNWAAFMLVSVRGEGVAVIGGDSRALSTSDTPTNSGAAALEFNLLHSQSKALPTNVLSQDSASFWVGHTRHASLSALTAVCAFRPFGWVTALSGEVMPTSVGLGFNVTLPTPRLHLGEIGGVLSRVSPSLEVLGGQSLVGAWVWPYKHSTFIRPYTQPIGGGAETELTLVGSLGGRQTVGVPVGVCGGLEATSEGLPTRTGAVEWGDLVQVNARNVSVPALGEKGGLLAELGQWAGLWSWYVVGAGFPWDRGHRSQFNRRPHTGLGMSEAATLAQQGASVLSLQRSRFDKGMTTLLQPHLRWAQVGIWQPELALAVLEAERSTLLPTNVVVLPTPYLDLDPAFLFTRWAAEVNTSRRSDHDARFKVLWGPLAASARYGVQVGTPWSHVSGSMTTAGLSTLVRQKLFWIAQLDGAQNLSASLSKRMAPAPALFENQTGAGGSLCLDGSRYTAASIWAGILFRLSLEPYSSQTHVRWLYHGGEAQRPSGSYKRPYVGSVTGLQVLGTQAHSSVFQSQLEAGSLLGLHGGQTSNPFAHISTLLPVSNQTHTTPSLILSAEQVRSGYLPMQTDIAAMRRLRVTKGVYLPADTPMHGIFGSKDVIHSWAIPGLGVKIDCIPGYSSHRRLILRWRGLFWGQCMEVCGRYHHWMPILVRVAHRDVFTLWCLTHLRALAQRPFGGARVLGVEQLTLAWAAATQASAHPSV